MHERHIQLIRTEDPGDEDAAATRERLKSCFPPGAARRMTLPGMFISAILNDLNPARDDAIVHASQHGESRALEAFLDSFPAASPTGFQTSIHPGAVQQGMIRRAQPVTDFFPMSGRDYLPGQSLLVAMLAPAARVILCGGEERGTWLAPIDAAATRAFAYGLALARNPPPPGAPPAAGRVALAPSTAPAKKLSHAAWFDHLHARKNFSGVIVPGWRVEMVFKE